MNNDDYYSGWTFTENWAGGSYIDEVRIVKGVALWTSDFTPPTAAY